jgi:hypothetical protein
MGADGRIDANHPTISVQMLNEHLVPVHNRVHQQLAASLDASVHEKPKLG